MGLLFKVDPIPAAERPELYTLNPAKLRPRESVSCNMPLVIECSALKLQLKVSKH